MDRRDPGPFTLHQLVINSFTLNTAITILSIYHVVSVQVPEKLLSLTLVAVCSQAPVLVMEPAISRCRGISVITEFISLRNLGLIPRKSF